MIDIRLTRDEQDALAELCQIAASANWKLTVEEQPITLETIRKLEETVLRYERLNWGRLYDVLHRTGSNQET